MDTLTVTLEFPRDLLGAPDSPATQVEDELRELIVP